MMPYINQMMWYRRRLIVPCFSNSMTGTGKSSNIIGRSNKCAILSIFRSANRLPFETISLRRSVAMFNCSDYKPPTSFAIFINYSVICLMR